MKKRIAIIGSGIAGLTAANLFKSNSDFEVIVYEREKILSLDEGYGIQLGPNSISILNKIGFRNIGNNDIFNPLKLNFYSNNNKICDLDLGRFNNNSVKYTTLQRSTLIEFLKDKLFTNNFRFGKEVKKVSKIKDKLLINFFDNTNDLVDFIIVSDGVFSKSKSDAIHNAHTPFIDSLYQKHPNAELFTDGKNVGLPEGQMGNSEVGHLNIGAGRIVYQDLAKINKACEDHSISKQDNLKKAFEYVKSKNKKLHLIGLVSNGGVHSHQNQIAAVAKVLNETGVRVVIHAFLDGRDTPPKSALNCLNELESNIQAEKIVSISSVSGRYYSMDRDKRWDRVRLAYDTIMFGAGQRHKSASAVVHSSYLEGITDEFVLPAIVGGYAGVQPDDGLLIANFRADRVRQLLGALVDPNFEGFSTKGRIGFAAKVGLTE